MINIMQNYCGLAIRSNRNDSYGMKKSVGATLFHCTEMNDESSRHRFFSQTGDAWCKWKYDKRKWTNTYKSHISIPKWIHAVLKSIFISLYIYQAHYLENDFKVKHKTQVNVLILLYGIVVPKALL